MNKYRSLFSFILSITSFIFFSTEIIIAEEKEIFLDAVVATVNGEPITLQETLNRIPGKPKMGLKSASDDLQVRTALNSIIMERLIKEEAASRRIQASNPEIEGYINEIANRNSLSRDGFEIALKEQGQTIKQYRQQVEVEILRTKIASTLLRGGIGVTREEIDSYMNEHPEFSKSGSKVKLRQIFISFDEKTEEDALEMIGAIKRKIEEGDEFSELAKKYSESAEAREGGLLGVLAEEDLNRAIFDGIFGLEEESTSDVVETAAGYHIFFVEERYVEKDEDQKSMRTEVRKVLEDQKLQAKMQTFFSHELFKLHAVENKL